MLNLSITQHQNGFLKIALPLGGRLHVWSPWNPPVAGPIAEIHDHPFAFDSFVLAGEMQNVLLSATDHPNGDYIEQTAACVTSFGPQNLWVLPVPLDRQNDEPINPIYGDMYASASTIYSLVDAKLLGFGTDKLDFIAALTPSGRRLAELLP